MTPPRGRRRTASRPASADVAPLSESRPRVRRTLCSARCSRSEPDHLDPGRPLLHHGQRVGIVVQPLAHADAHVAPDDQQPPAVGERSRLGDDGARAHRHALVAPADLGAPLNEDDAEARIAGQTIPREGPIARLEDVERDLRVRIEDGGKGEHAQSFEGRLLGCGIGHRHPIVTTRRAPAILPTGPPERVDRRTRAGPASKAGPVLVSLVLCTQLTRHQPSALGCEGRVVGRPEHAPARARPQ